MKAGQGALLVIVGLFVLYLAVTGRLSRLPQALKFLNTGAGSLDQPTAGPGGPGAVGASPSVLGVTQLPGLPPLRALPALSLN